MYSPRLSLLELSIISSKINKKLVGQTQTCVNHTVGQKGARESRRYQYTLELPRQEPK